MTDLRAAFERIFGPTDWDQPCEWVETIEPDVDLYVSDSEAEHMQRAVDSRLAEMWGRQ